MMVIEEKDINLESRPHLETKTPKEYAHSRNLLQLDEKCIITSKTQQLKNWK